jgi:glycosyltransferase involved in cell wall biosynthesis
MSLLLEHYRSFDPDRTRTHADVGGAQATSGEVARRGAGRGSAQSARENALSARGETAPPVLDIVIPVHNEVHAIVPSVRRLHAYLSAGLPSSFRITVVDNGSVDGTWTMIRRLHQELDGLAALRLAEKGRGRALRAGWSASNARVLAYCDVDLSTDLGAVLPLLAPLLSGHSDLAIGSRLARGARIVRGRRRDLISRCYNVILRSTLRAHFSDAQCGFKAITADAAQLLLPMVADNGWFFDTELLVLAERAGLRIYEVPVDWIDDPDSRVDVVNTALRDVVGIARLCRTLPANRRRLAEIGSQLGRGPLANRPPVAA